MVIVNLLVAPASYVHAIQMVSTLNEFADKFIFGSLLNKHSKFVDYKKASRSTSLASAVRED